MSLALLWLMACGGDAPAERQPLPDDTGEASVFTIDTGDFLPVDTALDPGTEDDIPDNLLTILQAGSWSLSPLGGPFTDLSGTLFVQEFVDALDPDEPEYACEATYNLTGQAVDEHDCGDCDFVFDVSFFVTDGDAGPCREPDTPQHEEVWQMGFSDGQGKLLRNYGGSGVWVPWTDGNLAGSDLTFSFELIIAIQVEEEETP